MPGLGRATGARVDAQRTAGDGRVGSGQAERCRGAAARELGEDAVESRYAFSTSATTRARSSSSHGAWSSASRYVLQNRRGSAISAKR